MSARLTIAIASLYGFFAVALGAFGAHALKGQISEKLLNAYQTGVHYQLAHALALLVVGMFMQQRGFAAPWLRRSAVLFSLGVLLFSGSLYGLALTGMAWLGPVTPLGGVCLLLAWFSLFMSAISLNGTDDV
jgi:uncharacterized membrane protein YgdD (TMEM256/DUF423 family)